MNQKEMEQLAGRTVSVVVKNRFATGMIIRVGKVTEVTNSILTLEVEENHLVSFPLEDVVSAADIR